MPKRTLILLKLLVLTLLAFPFALLAQNPSAAEEWKTLGLATGQPQELADFLGSLADQPLPGGENFTPAPENKVIYCGYQSCPTGQRCWYCRSNWVCVWEYPDPDQVPSGCTGGSQ
jgi:hypothetical protein